MKLPYENATSGQKAISDIQKILRSFGCDKFATGEDFKTGEVFIQFEHLGRPVCMKASARGYATAWLKHNPWSTQRHLDESDYEAKALRLGSVAIYSVLRDWVKGQVTAIEIGIMSFDAAFLSHILLPSGKRVIEELTDKKMLPKPKEDNNE